MNPTPAEAVDAGLDPGVYNVGAAVRVNGEIRASKHGVGGRDVLNCCIDGPCDICLQAIESWEATFVEHGMRAGQGRLRSPVPHKETATL